MVSATELMEDSARAVTVVENQERSQTKRRELEVDTVPEVIGTELAKERNHLERKYDKEQSM